jgi:carboxyl-terminal processing protease
MVGDKCLVMAVKPGSDAEKKGLKPGDTLLKIGDFGPTRSTIWKIEYVYRSLAPRSMLNLSVQSPGGAPRDVQIAAKITQKPPVKEYSLDFFEKTLLEESEEAVTSANRASQVGNVAVWQLSGFTFEPGEADKVFDAVVKGASTLVIDMRGNPGGYVATLQKIAARLFDREVTLATVKQRKSAKPMVSKPKKPVFTGKVVLIIDADSASAAEVLARAMQLEERGTVIGDQSAGAVMQGIVASDALESLEGFILFGASITNADLIMKDGKSLERVGVTPNEIVLASPADLAAGLDKVLARAVELAGGQLDAASAGKMFPIEWKK